MGPDPLHRRGVLAAVQQLQFTAEGMERTFLRGKLVAGGCGVDAAICGAVACGSLRGDPVFGSVGRAVSGSPWATVTTLAPRSFEGVDVRDSRGICTTATTMTAAAATPRPQAHGCGTRANQRARPGSAVSRTAARWAGVSRSYESAASASSSAEADSFSSLTSARASGDDSISRSTDARSDSSSSPSM